MSQLSKPVNEWRAVPNNIRFLIENPCGASPWIYLETLLPTIGLAVIDLLSFGLSDVLIGYARPKIRRGWNRFDRGKSTTRKGGRDGLKRSSRGFEIPEIGNEIGKHLPGSKFVQSLTDNKLGHLFWLPIDIAERGLYWWMVFDLIKDGIYNWSSEIYKAQCTMGAGGPGFISGRGVGSFGPLGRPQFPSGVWTKESFHMDGDPNAAPHLISTVAPHNLFVHYQSSGKAYGAGQQSYPVPIVAMARNDRTGAYWQCGAKVVTVKSGTFNQPADNNLSYTFMANGATSIDLFMYDVPPVIYKTGQCSFVAQAQ